MRCSRMPATTTSLPKQNVLSDLAVVMGALRSANVLVPAVCVVGCVSFVTGLFVEV